MFETPPPKEGKSPESDAKIMPWLAALWGYRTRGVDINVV